MKNLLASFLLCPLLAGCAPLAPIDPNQTEHPTASISNPDLESQDRITQRTQNFVVEGYGDIPQVKSSTAEKILSDILSLIGVYGFKPRAPYRVVVYRDATEYRDKTGKPDGPGGHRSGLTIYVYDHHEADSVMAYHLAHLVLAETFEGLAQSQAWLEEGLAMIIEARHQTSHAASEEAAYWLQTIRRNKLLSLEEILAAQSKSEDYRRYTEWNATAASLVHFLMDKGGTFNFTAFLSDVGSGVGVEHALQKSYAGRYRNLEDLYLNWKSTYGL